MADDRGQYDREGTLVWYRLAERIKDLTIDGGGTLALSANPTTDSITFETLTHVSGTLHITGWRGQAGTSGTEDRVFVGSAPTKQCLDHIHFTGYPDGALLLGKELVPKSGIDLVAIGLAWNTTTGGVDARYRVDGGALPAATTAKLFWANGTSVASILSPTPIVLPEPIPAGTGGPGSGDVIEFNVPAASLGIPASGATHILLLLDYEPPLADGLVQEERESNNCENCPSRCVAAIISPRVLNNGKTMEITFTPDSGLTLAEAAARCGYDHFNWLSIVTAHPRPSVAALLPIFDPAPINQLIPPRWHDPYPFYWDEGPAPLYANSEFVVGNPRNTPNAYTFRFEDTPYDAICAGPGAYIQFRTFLVGVRSVTRFDLICFGADCGLEWKSNNNGDPGTGVEYSTGNLEDTFGGTGGIFDVGNVSIEDIPWPERSLLATAGVAHILVPRLIVYTTNNSTLSISWPIGAADFSLEYAAGLPTSEWLHATNELRVIGDRFVATFSPSSKERFLRLRRPK